MQVVFGGMLVEARQGENVGEDEDGTPQPILEVIKKTTDCFNGKC